MSPLASETLGQWLHALTGKWNLEDYIGHDAYIVAASAVVYNALGRLQDDHAMQASFKQYVERPATLCIPLLLATFSFGNGADDLPIRLLRGAHRLLAERVLAAAVRHADLPAGLRCAGVADPAKGSAVSTDRQRLSRRVGRWHPGLHRAGSPPPMCLRCRRWRAAPWCGCSPAVRCRIRAHVGAIVAHQDEVVPTADRDAEPLV